MKGKSSNISLFFNEKCSFIRFSFNLTLEFAFSYIHKNYISINRKYILFIDIPIFRLRAPEKTFKICILMFASLFFLETSES